MGYDGEDIRGTPRYYEDFGPDCECQACDACQAHEPADDEEDD